MPEKPPETSYKKSVCFKNFTVPMNCCKGKLISEYILVSYIFQKTDKQSALSSKTGQKNKGTLLH